MSSRFDEVSQLSEVVESEQNGKLVASATQICRTADPAPSLPLSTSTDAVGTSHAKQSENLTEVSHSQNSQYPVSLCGDQSTRVTETAETIGDPNYATLPTIIDEDNEEARSAGPETAKHVTVSIDVSDDGLTQPATSEVHEAGEKWPEPEDKKNKKKKKKKTSGKKKKVTPTGFEEFYADPPLTVSEYNDEHWDIYCDSRTFIERMEQCIQRYRARRKLDEMRANVFNKYLTLGGIDTTMKAFTGSLDQEVIENSTAGEIVNIQARDHIRGGTNPKFYDPDCARNWIVDFEGVAKGFLSQRAPEAFGRDPTVIRQYCAVVRNFLNYVIHHGVCLEYTDDVLAAKLICDRAEEELMAINEVGKLMPGGFNMAASVLYGGYYRNIYMGSDGSWAPEPIEDKSGNFPPINKRSLKGMTIAEAERIFKTAIAFVGTYEMFKAMNKMPKVTKAELRSMEVVSVALPTAQKRKLYAGVKDLEGETGNITPLGTLIVKHWVNHQAEVEDLTEEEEAQVAKQKNLSGEGPTEEFWLEEDVLDKCFVGMKFEATVRELDIGVKYFDSIVGIYPSFFTYLPADRLHGWKEPVPDARPAPSVNNMMNHEDGVDADFD